MCGRFYNKPCFPPFFTLFTLMGSLQIFSLYAAPSAKDIPEDILGRMVYHGCSGFFLAGSGFNAAG
jgi:hypothetical protein